MLMSNLTKHLEAKVFPQSQAAVTLTQVPVPVRVIYTSEAGVSGKA